MAFDDIRLRLGHAEVERQALATKVEGFIDSKPCEVIIGSLAGERRQFVVKVSAEPPTDFQHTISGIVNAVRSSLDHLVYEAAVLSGSDPDTPGVRTQFPIVMEGRKYPKVIKRDLAGVDDRFRRVIASVQPFRRGAKMVRRDPLAQLNWMSNRDKHRTALTQFVQVDPLPVPIHVLDLRTLEVSQEVPVAYGIALHDGDVVATVHNATPFDSYIYPTPPIEVAFGRPELTIERVGYIIEYVETQVVRRLERAI